MAGENQQGEKLSTLITEEGLKMLNKEQLHSTPGNAIKREQLMTLGKEKTPEEESDFELEIEYDPSSLTLEQSVKQLFNIISSVKIPSIERQQINALQNHISKLMAQP